MELYLMKFSKKINSTKIPLLTNNPYNIVLKDSTDLMNPHFIIKESLSNINEYNYAYFLGRYYFIDRCISLTNNNVEIVCSVDALSTYRTEIMESTQYVVYATNGNSDILDNRTMLSQLAKREYSLQKSDIFTQEGCFIFSCVGGGSPTTGFTDSFALSSTQIQGLARNLTETKDFFDAVKEYFSNPYEGIISCIYVPISLSKINGTDNAIRISGFDSGYSGKRIDNSLIRSSAKIPIPLRTNTYIDVKPFTSIRLFLPFVGLINIEPELIYKEENITISYTVDVLTGDIAYYISSGNMIITQQGTCGTILPVASVRSYNPISAIGGLISFGVGLASTNPIAIIAGLGATISSYQQHTAVNGSLGGRSGINALDFSLYVEQKQPSENINNKGKVIGLPYGKTIKLKELVKQYVQCQNASVEIAGEIEEIRNINSALEGGLYLE